MHCNSPLASAGFSMFAASRLPCPPPAPTIVWNSSMNITRFGSLLAALIIALILFSKSPLYLVPATTDAMSSDTMRLFFNTDGIVPSAIFIAMPSTMADFPTPGSPISIGLFFFRRPRISITREISLSLPTTGSNLPSAAALVRSMPNSEMMSVSCSLPAASVPPSLISSPSSLCPESVASSPFFSM